MGEGCDRVLGHPHKIFLEQQPTKSGISSFVMKATSTYIDVILLPKEINMSNSIFQQAGCDVFAFTILLILKERKKRGCLAKWDFSGLLMLPCI